MVECAKLGRKITPSVKLPGEEMACTIKSCMYRNESCEKKGGQGSAVAFKEGCPMLDY